MCYVEEIYDICYEEIEINNICYKELLVWFWEIYS